MQIGDWVPQVFYDLIGRIVPSAVLTFVGFSLFCEKDQIYPLIEYVFKTSEMPWSFLFLSSILLFYTLGTLIGGIGFAITFKEWKDPKLPWFPVRLPNRSEPGSGLPFMYDAIQFHSQRVGARCAKLRAEAHMCRVFLIGFIFILIVWSFLIDHSSGKRWDYWTVISALLVACLASCLFHRHLTIRSYNLLINHWQLLGFSEPSDKLENQKDPKDEETNDSVHNEICEDRQA